ncbi:Uncharacterized protein LW93_2396 [Fusarium fujikuroi]|nr:Uncharacterized protein LW93_2396 [Fusarium fujikuroi]
MAAFLRGKQTGMQNDLSASIRPELFMPDDQARYGINSQIRYRSVSPNMYQYHSLLAIGTGESKFGPGKVYIFGQRRVHKILEPPRRTSFQIVQFSANRLVTVDAKNELGIWDLDTGERIAALVVAGRAHRRSGRRRPGRLFGDGSYA